METLEENEAPLAPGMLASHYAPKARLRLDAPSAGANEALLAFGKTGVGIALVGGQRSFRLDCDWKGVPSPLAAATTASPPTTISRSSPA